MSGARLGLWCLALWIIVSAASRVIAHGVLAGLSPFVVCFYVFATVQALFLSLNGRALWRKRGRVRERAAIVLLLNLAAIGAWYGSLCPLKHLRPTLVSSSISACSPLFAWLIARSKGQAAARLDGDSAFPAALFALGAALLWSQRGADGWAGAAAWCVIAAASIAATAALSKALEMPAGESLALRFWALVAFSWCGARLSGQSLLPGLAGLAPLATLAALYGALPLYLVQVSINRLEPLTITTAMPFIPLSVFLIETRLTGVVYSTSTVAIVGAIFVSSIAAVARRYRFELGATVRSASA